MTCVSDELMDWIVVKQDLVTLECKRCGATYKMSAKMPIRIDEYLALMGVAKNNWGVYHMDCTSAENAVEQDS